MPEAAVEIHGYASRAEQDIGPAAQAGEWCAVDPVAQTSSVQFATQRHLWSGVADPLALHPTADSRSAREGAVGGVTGHSSGP